MNTEKKLEHFTEAIAKEVEAKKRKARWQMAADMNEAVSRGVAGAETEAELYISNEKQAVQKAGNKRISEAKTQYRRALTALHAELTAKLLEGVKADIVSFIQSHEYESYLIGSIQTALAQSRHSLLYVQLTQADLRLGSIIRDVTGLIPEQGEEDSIGGFRLLSANRGVAVDCTFKSRLAKEAEVFHIA